MNTKSINLEGLDRREVTAGMNGYPEPVAGVAIFATSTEELAALADKTGGEIALLHWRDGWSNCESKGWAYIGDMRKNSIAALDDNHDGDVIDLADYDHGQWLDQELDSWRIPGVPDEKNADLCHERLEKIRACADELLSYKDAGHDAALISCYDVLDYYYGLDVGYADDTHTYQLGVFFDFADGWSYGDKCAEVHYTEEP